MNYFSGEYEVREKYPAESVWTQIQVILSGIQGSACQRSPQKHKDKSYAISSILAQLKWSLRATSS